VESRTTVGVRRKKRRADGDDGVVSEVGVSEVVVEKQSQTEDLWCVICN